MGFPGRGTPFFTSASISIGLDRGNRLPVYFTYRLVKNKEGRPLSDRSEVRKEQIFRVAMHLFALHGYERTSLQEVATELGVTKPALYYYYPSKEELLFEIMTFAMDRVLADIREVSASPLGPYEKLEAYIRKYVLFFTSHPDAHKIMSSTVDSLGPKYREIILNRQRQYLSHVRAIVSEIMAPKMGLDATAAGFALLGGMNWLFTWYNPEGPISQEKLVQDFVKMYAYGLFGAAPR